MNVRRLIRTVAVFACLTGGSAAMAAGPGTRIYRVDVQTSYGTQFFDCFRFNRPGTGDLRVDGIGTFAYQKGGLDKLPRKFKAVTTGNSFEVAFHGSFSADYKQLLDGEGVSDEGDSFTFTGTSVTSCTASPDAAITRGGSPYRH